MTTPPTPPTDRPTISDPTYNSSAWWEAAREHRLLFRRCKVCNTAVFPPRDTCPGPECLEFGTLEWDESRGYGRIFSYTAVRQPADRRFAADAPYTFAIVELDEGFRLFARITNRAYEETLIGQRVEVDWNDVTPEFTLPNFRVTDD